MNLELLLQHAVIAVFISALITSATKTVKERLIASSHALSNLGNFMLTIGITLVISLGVTIYYFDMPLSDSLAILVISFFGAQGLYGIIKIGGKENENIHN